MACADHFTCQQRWPRKSCITAAPSYGGVIRRNRPEDLPVLGGKDRWQYLMLKMNGAECSLGWLTASDPDK